MLVFVEGGKPENPEKNPRSKDENQQQTQPTYDAGSGNRTRATLVGSERSHHCAIPAPLNIMMMIKLLFSLSIKSPSALIGDSNKKKKNSNMKIIIINIIIIKIAIRL